MAGDGARGGCGDSSAGSGRTTLGVGAGGLPIDVIFELLANRRRRVTLYCLAGSSEPVVTLDELVDSVAAIEAALDPSLDGPRHDRRVERDLATWHLEVLAETGVVEYDDRSGSVRFHGDPSLERWLARVRAEELDGDHPP